MPRGGRRAGKQGKAYGRRTDLNAAAPSKTYGDRAAQEAAMRAVPVAPPPTSPPPAGAGSPPPPAGGGPLPPIDAPTNRPNEPLTHGLTGGAGGGPDILNSLPAGDPSLDELRAIYQRFPTEEIRELIEEWG